MISKDALLSVRNIYTHANCADGRAAAIILHAALPDAEIIEVAHDTAAHRAIEPAGDVLFCDMVPWLPKIGETDPVGDEFHRKCLLSDWVESGAIVLDHHEGTQDIVTAFGDRGVFGENEKGESGAWLAYDEVAMHRHYTIRPPARMLLELATLAAIRDTWQRSSSAWQWACEVSEVLRFLTLEECLFRGANGVLSLANDIGGMLWAKKQKTAQKVATGAVRMPIGGHRAAIISSTKLTSDVADVLGGEVDVVAGFDYIHEDGVVFLQWSLRSKTGVDVSAIARANGGDGHKPAAGFKIPLTDTAMTDPYSCALGLLCPRKD